MATSGPPENSFPRIKHDLCPHCHLEGFVANLSVQRQFFPTDEDESGAARALMRLQDTYKLDPDTISRGELPGNALSLTYVSSVSGQVRLAWVQFAPFGASLRCFSPCPSTLVQVLAKTPSPV